LRNGLAATLPVNRFQIITIIPVETSINVNILEHTVIIKNIWILNICQATYLLLSSVFTAIPNFSKGIPEGIHFL